MSGRHSLYPGSAMGKRISEGELGRYVKDSDLRVAVFNHLLPVA